MEKVKTKLKCPHCGHSPFIVRSYFERLEDTEAFVHPDGYVSEDSGNVLYSDLVTEPHDHECAECKENVSEFIGLSVDNPEMKKILN